MDQYLDRYEAGKVLAELLKSYSNNPNTIVLALPRGGVPVAYEIAKKLSLHLDVFVVRKLGVPDQEELAMGAIASGGVIVLNEDILREIVVSDVMFDAVLQTETKELQRREKIYRGDRADLILENKNIILVDDGVATGASIKVAIKALRVENPAKIIVAVPVAALSTLEEISKLVEEIYCPFKPIEFHAVGTWFENFEQTSDEEVSTLLSKQ